MADELFAEIQELMRETFEGARPGAGTQYLDHDSGIRSTLRRFSAEQASVQMGRHPSIVAHVRHMIFHLRVAREWIAGDHSKRDWEGSFLPQTATDDEWSKLTAEIENARTAYLDVIRRLSPEARVTESGAMGVIAHLAYHLGAIRQYLPPLAAE
jgi:hypothetical protein